MLYRVAGLQVSEYRRLSPSFLFSHEIGSEEPISRQLLPGRSNFGASAPVRILCKFRPDGEDSVEFFRVGGVGAGGIHQKDLVLQTVA